MFLQSNFKKLAHAAQKAKGTYYCILTTAPLPFQKGKNSIGCSLVSNVRITDIQNQLPSDVAVISISQYLMTLQSTSSVVKVMSNMLNKRQAVPLPRGKQYVVEMEKQFFFGNFKCLVQVLPLQQLKMIKNVENQVAFTFDAKNFTQGYASQRKPYNNFSQQAYNTSNKSQRLFLKNGMELQKGQQPQSPNSSKTEKLQEQGGFQPTLQMDCFGGFSPTIQLNEDIQTIGVQVVQSNKQNNQLQFQDKINNIQTKVDPIDGTKSHDKTTNQSFEQLRQIKNDSNLLMNSQSLKPKQKIPSAPKLLIANPSLENESQQISMPDTLNEGQMPPTIQDPEYDEMPPTIQQGATQDQLKKMIKSDFQLSRTVPVNTFFETQQQSTLKYKSWEAARIVKRKQQPPKEIQDFCDMFGVSSADRKNDLKLLDVQMPEQYDKCRQKQEIAQKTDQNNQKQEQQGYFKLHRLKKQSNASGKSQYDKKQQQIIIQKYNSTTESRKSQQLREPVLQKDQQLKKVAFSNMKVSQFTKKKLRDRGYIAITKPEQDYDLLLIGNELKRSTRLLCALLLGKQIKNQAWLHNKSVKITGKLQGFLWENIQKIKGRHGNIFKGRYYLSPRLRQQFESVLQLGGANLVLDLSKARTNQDLSLVISVLDKQIYDKKKNYKRWNIYSEKMIIQSVLVGQEIKQKYLMDDFSFV